ncbi:iron ABC transporter permease [Microbacterium sp.]|uniref:FecCD family ABC transporter permease n=1 Tax=Microbacterium sp. TaxID=51671 RepID=UPI002899683E|nr:iron ABC transporter permease [Microbacterium sp.]
MTAATTAAEAATRAEIASSGPSSQSSDDAGARSRTPRAASRRRIVRTAVFATLIVALAVLVVVSAGTGQLAIPAQEVVGSLTAHWNEVVSSIGAPWLALPQGLTPQHPNGDATLWTVRFPRLALAVLAGAALAIAGAVMQGVFGNPLAEPAVVGVSTGAAVGACLVIVFGLTFAGSFTPLVLAFVTGIATTLLVYLSARSNGRTEVVTIVLTGVAVNALGGAVIALLVFLGDTQQREQIVFWQLGSLNGTRWADVAVVAPVIVIGVIGCLFLSRRLDLLALGERQARHLGVRVEVLRVVSITLVSLLTAAAVATCGIIAFVGLVVPHVMRMVLGPGHRALLPASALAGAVLLTGADLAARTLVPYAELPIGMLTALVGGPFFFWLLRRSRRQAGGWG